MQCIFHKEPETFGRLEFMVLPPMLFRQFGWWPCRVNLLSGKFPAMVFVSEAALRDAYGEPRALPLLVWLCRGNFYKRNSGLTDADTRRTKVRRQPVSQTVNPRQKLSFPHSDIPDTVDEKHRGASELEFFSKVSTVRRALRWVARSPSVPPIPHAAGVAFGNVVPF